MKFIIGIDLGGTSAKLALFTEDLEAIKMWQVATSSEDHGWKIVPNIVKALQAEILKQGLDLSDCLGIGMGSPGALDRRKGTVTGAYNLGWETAYPVKEEFKHLLGDFPVYIENDANVAALGEQAKGAAADTENMVLVTLGTGVGGGIVCNGRLLTGQASAGEIGHMIAKVDGSPCTCGSKGCIETIASATGIHRLAEEKALSSQVESPLAKRFKLGEDISVKAIVDAAKNGDALGEKVMKEAMGALGITLSQLACVLNPEKIVIGGGVANAGQYLIDQLQEVVEANTYPPNRRHLKILLAQLGNDAGVIGAASLVLKERKRS